MWHTRPACAIEDNRPQFPTLLEEKEQEESGGSRPPLAMVQVPGGCFRGQAICDLPLSVGPVSI
jgi:hypothetical protein